MMPMIDLDNKNLAYWNEFFRTDPGYTKDFTRGGGFKGTAITPMLAAFRLTGMFGPMGEGWGIDIMEHKLVTAKITEDVSELLIFQLIGLWYINKDGKRCVAGPQWGGDKVTVAQSKGIKSDDEAFKKAATDGFMKCASYLGIGADVHSGMFDDVKYFTENQSEFIRKEKAAKKPEPPKAVVRKDPEAGEEITADDVKNAWLKIYAGEAELGNTQEYVRGEAVKKQEVWLKDIPKDDQVKRRQTTYKEQLAWIDMLDKAVAAKKAAPDAPTE